MSDDRPPNALEPSHGLSIYQVWEFRPDGSAGPVMTEEDAYAVRCFPTLLEADAVCNDLAARLYEEAIAGHGEDAAAPGLANLPRYKVVEVQPSG